MRVIVTVSIVSVEVDLTAIGFLHVRADKIGDSRQRLLGFLEHILRCGHGLGTQVEGFVLDQVFDRSRIVRDFPQVVDESSEVLSHAHCTIMGEVDVIGKGKNVPDHVQRHFRVFVAHAVDYRV